MKKSTALLLVYLLVLGMNVPVNAQSSEWERLNAEVNTLYKQGHYDQAVAPAQKALQEAERTWGPDHPSVAMNLNSLGLLYSAQGRYAQAEPLYQRALAIREKVLGPEDAYVAQSVYNLADLYQSQGRYAEAEPLFRRSLAIFEKVLGTESPLVALNLNSLATLYYTQGRYAQAEPLFKRALAIREKVFGPEHADVAKSVNNLAQLYESQGRYTEAEPLFRRSLAIFEKVFGAESPVVAANLNNLAVLLQEQGRYTQAEPLYKRALAIREKVLGPDSPDVAQSLDNLGALYQIQAQYAEAKSLFDRALAIRERVLGPDHPDLARSLNTLASLFLAEGQLAQAEPLYKRALAIREKALGPDHPDVAESLNNLAMIYDAQGRYTEAEPFFRRSLTIWEKALGPDNPLVATSLNNFALLYEEEGRYAQAETLLKRALAIRSKALGPDHPDVASSLNNLAQLLQQQDQSRQAEPLFKRALAIWEKALGPDSPDVAHVLSNLAALYETQAQYSEARALCERALAIREKTLGPDDPHVAVSLNNLADLYREQGHYLQAEPLYKRALAIFEKALGPDRPLASLLHENLGYNFELQSKFAEATANYRLACSARSSMRGSRDLSGDLAQVLKGRSNFCSTRLSLALWSWAAQGGGAGSSNRPDALRREAFEASQRAVQSAAGEAMARSAALTAAKSSSVGPQAQAYEEALLEKDRLDRQFGNVAAAGGAAALEKRGTLSRARDEIISRIERLARELQTRAPLYWNYRSPQPLSVASLQATTGPNARLLREDEALITILVSSPDDKGLVFAVSKERAAWAQLPMTGQELQTRIVKLRTQIDPEAYALRGATIVQNVGSDAHSRPGAFDRQAAYEIYQALLGDMSIQTVIKDKPVLLFVPSGPLTSLPPALLVTAPPPDGAEHDAYPDSLRATAWLLRTKAVALLPAVSSLTTLRQILPATVDTSDPLLAFADPDFRRPAVKPNSVAANAVPRGFSTYFRDGLPLAEALQDVPSLPGTRIEGEALQRVLQGRPGSLLTGRAASKAELIARNGDGRLAKVRVLEFATHGLVAGDASDLAEPALILAAGARPEDELLLASEAATLKLNADWVLLSACNTASPDAPEAEGLSGLSRAFFYAGARSLLVSHWRVRDDVPPELIPAMLLAEQKNPAMSRAEALRRASLAVLDDPGLNAANPSAWAPFTLIGEAAR